MIEQPKLIEPVAELTPDLVIEFSHMPSWNDYLASHANIGFAAGFMRKWKAEAEDKIRRLSKAQGLKLETWIEYPTTKKGKRLPPIQHFRLARFFFTRPIAIDIRIWRPDASEFDVHNPCVKPIFDGFKDARLFVSDSVTQVKEVGFIFEGIDRTLAPTKQERDARRLELAERREKGQKPNRKPMRARYRLEFFIVG